MAKETTIPIGVWAPALLAVAALIYCMGSGPQVRSVAKDVVARPDTSPPPDPTPISSDQGSRADEQAPPDEIARPDEPTLVVDPDAGLPVPPAVVEFDGWRPLDDAPPPAPPGESVFAWRGVVADWHARLGREAGRFVQSGERLAPLVVIAERSTLAASAPLVTLRDRWVGELLEPLRRSKPRDRMPAVSAPLVVVLLPPARQPFEPLPSGAIVIRSDEEPVAWLAPLARLTLESALGSALPAWWVDGAVGLLAAPTALVALHAAPERELRPLFERVASGQDDATASAAREALAGSFAAWCLGAAGVDPHRRATWLEAAVGEAASASSLGEVAARFGCASFEELEQRWRGAVGG